MVTSAIIVAAGSGKRMGAPIPKQFIEINGKTILEHSLEKFISSSLFDEIIVVLSKDYCHDIAQQIKSSFPNEEIKTVVGGAERFHSVQNALNEVNSNCNIVFIHDAVRPLCGISLLNRCYDECKEHASAIPAIALKDSIREIEVTGNSKIVNRDRLRSIQTPQVFDYNKLHKAYQTSFSEAFTDDASVYEQAGYSIHLTQGESTNIKITTPDDLAFAKLWLQR